MSKAKPVTLDVLDHGKVSLIDWMGDDLAIVNAAQSSFDRESETFGDREQKILASLMREEHGVPFEATVLKFRLRLPLFLARQFVKHRMSSWSEHSGRYSVLERLNYIPKHENVRVQVGRPMEYRYEVAEWHIANDFIEELKRSNDLAWDTYERAMSLGEIAKEQARFSLPENRYTTVTWTLNARSLFNVLRLRVDAHAQWEAQQYAKALEALACYVMPAAMDLFIESGRPKP